MLTARKHGYHSVAEDANEDINSLVHVSDEDEKYIFILCLSFLADNDYLGIDLQRISIYFFSYLPSE